MPALFKNNVTATLAASITTSDTTIVLAAGLGSLFPSPSGSSFFYATLFDSVGNYEIVKCTARVTDTLTVVRAQDNTTAQAFLSGSGCAMRPVSAVFDNLVQLDSSGTLSGTLTLSGNNTHSGNNTLSGNNTFSGTNNFSGVATLASPVITGTPTAPTAAVGTNTTQIATTAFVLANVTPVGGAGGFISVQYFTTPGAITWTRPAGIKKIYVYVIGGGGPGLIYSSGGGTGGGAGGCAIKLLDVTSIASISGNVGTGGVPSGTTPTAGTSSTFNAPSGTITGNGGGIPSAPGGYPQGGTGGSATGGDLNIPGETPGSFFGGSTWGLSGGRPAFFGMPGAGGGYGTVGQNGLYGGGGGSAGYGGTAGTGGSGIIVVYEYN
jgi:hypothetical protein